MAAAVLASAALAACAPEHESELLEVRHVAPERIEPGQLLRIHGEGFPPGRNGRVRLEGNFHAPGASARRVELDLEATAVSTDEVEVPFTDAALATLGGRGTFRGRLKVLFAASGGAVVGHSPPLTLDVMQGGRERLGDELSRRRRGAQFMAELGLALAEHAPGEAGLVVKDVEPDSIAAQLGLLAGDRLLVLDGVALRALSDFVPPPGRREVRIEAKRDETPFAILAPLGDRSGELSRVELVIARLALGWLLVVLLFLAPSARILEGWTAGGRRNKSSHRFLRAAIAAAFVALAPGLDRGGMLTLALEALLALMLLSRTSAAHAGARRRGASAMFRAILGALAAGLTVALALGCVAAMGGTTELTALHALQGPAPWEWTALRTPAGPLLLGLVIVAGAWTQRERSSRWLSLSGDAVTLMLAASAAALLLGGWTGPDSGWMSGLAALGFVAKTLVCWSAMRRAGEIAWSARSIVGTGLVLVVAVALTGAWIVWEPGLEVERALAEVLTAAFGAALVWLATRKVAGLTKTEPLAPSHPFL